MTYDVPPWADKRSYDAGYDDGRDTPPALDVERLDRDLRSHFGEMLSANEYAAIRNIVRAWVNAASSAPPVLERRFTQDDVDEAVRTAMEEVSYGEDR